MTVLPPQNNPPPSNSSSSSSGPRDDKTRRKDFKLPEKKKEGKGDGQKEEAAIAADVAASKVQSQIKEEGATASAIAATQKSEAASHATQIAEMIHKMCQTLQVGQVGGKDFVSADLKASEVPSYLAGVNMTVTQTDKGIVVQFSQFATPYQQTNAIFAIEQNKEALSALVDNLQARNISLAELQIGNHMVTLPTPTTVVTAPSPIFSGSERQRGDEGGGKGGGQGGGEGGGGEGKGEKGK